MFYLLPKRIFFWLPIDRSSCIYINFRQKHDLLLEFCHLITFHEKTHQYLRARLFELCDVFSPRAAPEKRFSVEMEDEI